MQLGGIRLRDIPGKTSIVLMVLFLGILWWFFTDVYATLKPVQYSRYERAEYLPDKSSYCPGETLTFTPTIIIEKAPVVLELTTTFYEDNPPHSVGPRDLTSSVSRSIQLGTGTRSTPIKMTVPDLPPQPDYRIIRALEARNQASIVAITSVPFAIRADCN